MLTAIFSTLAALSASGGGAAALQQPAPAAFAAPPAEAWQIGPVIRGRNYSVGMPPGPDPAGSGWSFDFPFPDARAGHVHYVTFRSGALAGASRIALRYRIEAAPGVRFVPQEQPGETATVSLVIQQRGDNWSGRGPYEFYRWYAPGRSVREIAPGEYEMVVGLDERWTSVGGRGNDEFPRGYRDALAATDQVGLVFGSTSRRGHGVFATGPARFTLLSFRIE